MSKQADLAKNTLIIAAGRISTQLLVFLLLPLYTAYLTPKEYGELDIILIYVALLAPVFTVQMEMAVFRHLVDVRGDRANSTKVITTSATVASLGALLGAVVVWAVCVALDTQYTEYVVAMFLLSSAVNYLLQAVRGFGRNGLFALISLVIGVVTVAASLLFVLALEQGLVGVLRANLLGLGAGAILLAVSGGIIEHWRPAAFSRDEARGLLGYAWPLTVNHIGLWAINGINRTAIAVILGLAATGVFAAASRFQLIYLSLFGIFAMAWTEAASLHVRAADRSEFFSHASDSAIRLFGSLAIGIIAGVGLVFPLLVTSDFSEARSLIPLLIIAAFLSSMVTHYGAVYLAEKKTREVAEMTMQAVVMTTLLTIAGIYVIGIYAAAWALILTYFVLALRRHQHIQRYVAVRYRRSTFLTLGTVALVVIGLYYSNTIWASIAAITIAAAAAVVINKASLQGLYNQVIKGVRR